MVLSQLGRCDRSRRPCGKGDMLPVQQIQWSWQTARESTACATSDARAAIGGLPSGPGPMNIAVFVGEFPVLSETFVIRQIVGLIEAGHRVTVVTGEWGDRSQVQEAYEAYGLERVVRPIRSGRVSRWNKLRALSGIASRGLFHPSAWPALRNAVRAAVRGSVASALDIAAVTRRGVFLGHYDAIIAHFGPAGVRAMHLKHARLLSGPLAVVFHGQDMSDRKTLARQLGNYRELFKHAAMLLPVSRYWRERLLTWGAPMEKIHVLRMGVDLAGLAMLDADRPLHYPLRLLSVARFTEKKGLHYAIEGVLAARGPIRYEIIGAGPLEAELRAAVKDTPGKEIIFLGKRTQSDVFARLEQADVFLLPSVTAADGDMEGIPVALMEAMAKGVLVLTTRHSGIPELVEHRRSGLLVAERDASAIAEAIDDLQRSAEAVGDMRREARRVVEREFDNTRLDQECERICRLLSRQS